VIDKQDEFSKGSNNLGAAGFINSDEKPVRIFKSFVVFLHLPGLQVDL